MKFFSHPYRYLFIACLAVYSYLNTVFIEVFHYYGITGKWWIILSGFSLICLLNWEGSRIAESFIQHRKTSSSIHPSILLFLVSLPIAFITANLVYYVVGLAILQQAAGSQSILLRLTILFSFRVNLFLQCLNAILFFISSYKKKELEAEESKRISVQAQLRAIQDQVNPHFLFNNLNVLSTLVMQKNEDANKFIEAFSAVYRYLLKSRDSEMVRLKDEIEFIQPYIYLLQTRFGNSLHVDLAIPVKYSDAYIVPAALQLLIENAIKHNIVSAAQPLTIKLEIQDEIFLVVSNNLQDKLDKLPSTQLGLQNIKQRYKLLADKEIIIRRDDHSFSVSIPLLTQLERKTVSRVSNLSTYESNDH
ncbi:MAG: histidine kinase [Chitinophagaceae bacterium]